MDALERRNIDESGCITGDHQAVTVATLGQGQPATLGDRLGAPLEELAASQDLCDQRVPLESLQKQVDIEIGVLVIEADDQSERNLIFAVRVNETAAEGIGREWPAEGVDDPVQRFFDLPDLLDSQSKNLRVGRADALPLLPCLRKGAARAFT